MSDDPHCEGGRVGVDAGAGHAVDEGGVVEDVEDVSEEEQGKAGVNAVAVMLSLAFGGGGGAPPVHLWRRRRRRC